MDLLTAIGIVGGPVVAELIKDGYQAIKKRRKDRIGIVINPDRKQEEIYDIEGTFLLPTLDNSYTLYDDPTVLARGEFITDIAFKEDAHDFLYEGEKIIFMTLVNQNAYDVFLFEFDFSGYAIELWPGLYSFYAFIFNPITDTAFGIGYPYLFENKMDPNPIKIDDGGDMVIDFIMFDVNEFIYQKGYRFRLFE